ncbi:uncharacterized protein LOC104891721 [Beta vulgaris subsp. vulgaris]|uniref:uncharacterized protein LOC104891721 n=1 Tax=Beta vulgaris subsp. vulgaris TaxID=3555 RepID=UPI002036C95A|nr:uncharacterized protein LOC104891721 [Beta vulgaris subsp. vulgaris]
MKGWEISFPYSIEVLQQLVCLSWHSTPATVVSKLVNIPKQLWSPPSPGLIKWNDDASVNAGRSKSAIGGVLRNSQGLFMCLFSSPIPPMEINSAEILAIFRVAQISMAFEHLRQQHIIIEYDSSNAVKWCNDKEGGPWNLNFQLNYIRNAWKEWMNLSIVHKGRSSNVVADALAKQGTQQIMECSISV